MTETLFNIGDMMLSSNDIRIFAMMMSDPERSYQSAETEQPWVRRALDMLVIAGLASRTADADGKWLNEWQITDEGDDWASDPQVQADISLANSASEMFVGA